MSDQISYDKVFGIGAPKTATTSLTRALNTLGIKSIHNNTLYVKKDAVEIIKNQLSDYQGFTDAPFHKIYKDVDVAFPNSKFILTFRDPEKWWKSWQKHHRIKFDPSAKNRLQREEKFDEKNKDKFIRWYTNQNINKIEYFKNRPDDLLVIDITAEDNLWEKLCNFLGKDIPDEDFPHLNKHKHIKESFQKN